MCVLKGLSPYKYDFIGVGRKISESFFEKEGKLYTTNDLFSEDEIDALAGIVINKKATKQRESLVTIAS